LLGLPVATAALALLRRRRVSRIKKRGFAWTERSG
jgi:hypothetical protein